MITKEVKGIVADKTFVILNGVEEISPVSYYIEIVKDEKGVKHKKKHNYFEINRGDETIRFERLRDDLRPHRDTNYPHTLIVYTDTPIHEAREKVISTLLKK